MAGGRHRDTDGDLELFARCAGGFESVLARELKGLGLGRVRPLKGGVAFFGSQADAYRACLWSRVATRIQLVLARLDARDADALYAGCSRFAWERHVAVGATIAVEAHGDNPSLRNTQFTALKVKDAICDRLREARGERPDVNPHDPDFAVDVSVHASHATLYLNLSGQSLHRRGYREQGIQTEAPLKETLAAGMLLAAGWDELARSGAAFADPMCGSGTLAIEAAMVAADVAPGLFRRRWGFEGWIGHDTTAWSTLVDESRRRAEEGVSSCANAIVASDLDERAVSVARDNASRAGIPQLVSLSVADAATLRARITSACGSIPELGLVAVNPPYGRRLQTADSLPATYVALSEGISGLPSGWRMVAISPDTGLDTALGMAASQVIPCFNGPIQTSVRVYGSLAEKRTKVSVTSLAGRQRTVVVAEPNSEQFAARLRKAARERAKWARKAGVTCYRVYDADLPDYALSVDVFAGTGHDEGVRLARVEEKPAPASVDEHRADRRFADALALIPAVLDLERASVFAKPRHDLTPSSANPDRFVTNVLENGLTFEVNVGANRDTGLPLDLRPIREMLGEMAPGTRFLSLGSYAGAPATYAASGGAAQVTVVDPSSSYLAWARRNLEANGLMRASDHLERVSMVEFLSRARAQRAAFDLVYCDTSALSGLTAGDAASALAPGGTLVITSGQRAFRIDGSRLESAGLSIEDVTSSTIGHDFLRTPKVHSCWLLRRQ